MPAENLANLLDALTETSVYVVEAKLTVCCTLISAAGKPAGEKLRLGLNAMRFGPRYAQIARLMEWARTPVTISFVMTLC